MKRIADYRLETWIADVNHGALWRAHPPDRLGVEEAFVMVKVVDDHADEDAYRRVINELRVHRAAASDHLVEILDAGHERGRIYYAMRWYERGNLAVSPAPLPEKLQALADAARGAHALHEVGVAHRDIKPENVIVAADGGRLGDLGLAQLLEPGQTQTTISGPLGAIDFLEPDVAWGAPAGRASDIWALGVTLHVVLSGRSVYPDLAERDLLGALRCLSEGRPTIDASLGPQARTVVAWCLERDRSARPATAADLAASIDELARMAGPEVAR